MEKPYAICVRLFLWYLSCAMELLPVKTRVLVPPKDDLFSVLDESLVSLQEGDIVCISSKVVAIHQGRCVPSQNQDKYELARKEADLVIEREYQKSPLLVKQSTFIGSSGIDESNANGYFVLMPENLFEFAHELRDYLRKRFNIKNVGVIVTDSRSLPLRYGATGVSLSFWGFKPLIDLRGRKDLFGREIRIERSNLADGIAASSNVVMGEVSEGTPVVIVRNVPGVTYTEENTPAELFTGFEHDNFRVLYERFLK